VLRGDGRKIVDWEQWVDFIRKRPGQSVQLEIRRGDETLQVPVTIGSVDENGTTVGRIGASRPEIPASAFESLRAEPGTDEKKVFNLVRGLQDEIDNDPQSGAANLVEHDPMCGREPDGSCGLSCRCWCHDVESGCA